MKAEALLLASAETRGVRGITSTKEDGDANFMFKQTRIREAERQSRKEKVKHEELGISAT